MLKLVDENETSNQYLHKLWVSSHKTLNNCKEKNSNFMLKKPSKYHLHQVIKINITSYVINRCHPFMTCNGKNTACLLWYYSQNNEPKSSHENIADKPIQEHSRKAWACTLLKNQGHEGQRKTSSGVMENQMTNAKPVPGLDPLVIKGIIKTANKLQEVLAKGLAMSM